MGNIRRLDRRRVLDILSMDSTMIEIVRGAALPTRERKIKYGTLSAAVQYKRAEFERGHAFGLDMALRYAPDTVASFVARRQHARNPFDRGAVAGMKGEPIPWQQWQP